MIFIKDPTAIQHLSRCESCKVRYWSNKRVLWIGVLYRNRVEWYCTPCKRRLVREERERQARSR